MIKGGLSRIKKFNIGYSQCDKNGIRDLAVLPFLIQAFPFEFEIKEYGEYY